MASFIYSSARWAAATACLQELAKSGQSCN